MTPEEVQAALQSIEMPDDIPESPLAADSIAAMLKQVIELAVTQPDQLALGWWLSAALIILLIMSLSLWVYRYKKRNRYRKWALAELKTLVKVCDDGEFTRACAQLIKRTVVHAIDKHAASRFGEPWQQQLLHYYPKFNADALQAITVDQYKRNTDLAKASLYPEIRKWLRHHKPKEFQC